MRRIHRENINTPELFNRKFSHCLAISDMKRLRAMAKHFNGGVYADIGCFDSPMPPLLKERYPDSQIYGIDFAPKVIAFLSQKFPKVQYVVSNCYCLPFDDDSVDCLVAGELIEHLEEPRLFFEEARRVLKKDGWFSISTPNDEKGDSVGGKEHLWAFTHEDLQVFGFSEIEVIEGSLVAWMQK